MPSVDAEARDWAHQIEIRERKCFNLGKKIDPTGHHVSEYAVKDFVFMYSWTLV